MLPSDTNLDILLYFHWIFGEKKDRTQDISTIAHCQLTYKEHSYVQKQYQNVLSLGHQRILKTNVYKEVFINYCWETKFSRRA